MKLTFEIASGNFANVGKASSEIKKVLKQLRIAPKIIKRIVVAVYEAEVNIAAHSVGGTITAVIGNHQIDVEVKDHGPGIRNVEQAMQAGFSTASKEICEMGFGAGMGLPNIKKNTDHLSIKSKPGSGTTLIFCNKFQ